MSDLITANSEALLARIEDLETALADERGLREEAEAERDKLKEKISNAIDSANGYADDANQVGEAPGYTCPWIDKAQNVMREVAEGLRSGSVAGLAANLNDWVENLEDASDTLEDVRDANDTLRDQRAELREVAEGFAHIAGALS